MKVLGTLIVVLFLSCQFALAQDTLYIYRSGIVVTKQAVSDIDSITFSRNYDTPPIETVADIDGNVYHTVTIGTQTWMTENLKVSRYRNGDLIGTTIPATKDVSYEYTPKYQWSYNGDEKNVATYGRLYTWYAVADNRNIAPVGWHVATDAEWATLEDYLIGNGYNYDGSTTGNKIGKSLSAAKLWSSDYNTGAVGNDLGKNNKSGFSGVPAGYRGLDGSFYIVGLGGDHWTASESSPSNSFIRTLGNSECNLGATDRDKNYGFSVRCVKDAIIPPTVITSPISAITDSTGISGGNVTSDGGAAITARGICWSTKANPTIVDHKTTESVGTGLFTSVLTGLLADSTYYVRAYATNSTGTVYGNLITFRTLNVGKVAVTDLDGNVYTTITIGKQMWMKENLKVTKFRNGDLIPYVTDNSAWSALTTGGYSYYNNDATNDGDYGALYNWYAVTDSRNIAPIGWHVATDAEWTVLQDYLIANGYNYDGAITGNNIGKSLSDNKLWSTSSNAGAIGNDLTRNNASGFSAVPGGYRGIDGQFYWFGSGCEFWTSTEYPANNAWHSVLGYSTSVLGFAYCNKDYGFSVRCVKDTISSLPVLITTPVSAIKDTVAVGGGNITSDGGATITARGICWSTTANPTVQNSKTTEGIGTGLFTSAMTGLGADSTYYVRAYATNSVGTAYGDQVSFKTSQTGSQTVMDNDSNVYHTIVIGTQTWMVENLKTTKYNDGSPILLLSDYSQWISSTSAGYCWGNNDPNYKEVYGGIYNFYAVSTGKLAPKGWHVPTQKDIDVLATYLGGVNTAASKLKESGNVHWAYPNSDATNESGFNALPGGYRSSASGDIVNANIWGCWWLSDESPEGGTRFIFTNTRTDIDYKADAKTMGFNVRCIKD